MTRAVTDARDQSAERSLIGAVQIEPSLALELELDSRAFSHPLLGRLWVAAVELADRGRPLDPVSLGDAAGHGLDERKRADLAALATECVVAVPYASNASHYAEIVRRHWTTRRVLDVLAAVREAFTTGSADGDDLLGLAQSELAGVESAELAGARPIGELVRDELVALGRLVEQKQSGEPVIIGAPTGIRRLDELLGGAHYGQITAVLARPGMGKSAFARTMIDAVSAAGIGGHAFSLEDTQRAYVHRALSAESGVPSSAIRSLQLQREELGALHDAAGRLFSRRGWVVDSTKGLTVEDMIRRWRRHRRDNGTRVVLIDYAQLISLPRSSTQKKTELMSEALARLAAAADKDGMAVILLSQMNRDCERREGWHRRPQKEDAAESGALEQQAKTMLGLMRPAVYGLQWDPEFHGGRTGPVPENAIEIGVIKNNHGPTGAVWAGWDGPTTRIYDRNGGHDE